MHRGHRDYLRTINNMNDHIHRRDLPEMSFDNDLGFGVTIDPKRIRIPFYFKRLTLRQPPNDSKILAKYRLGPSYEVVCQTDTNAEDTA
jgi:hypothetical protein